jgi:hypothetical protein
VSPAPPGNLLEWVRKVQAIAQNGLAFSKDPFDRERYTELAELVSVMMSQQLQIPLTTTRAFWEGEYGYATPKVDVRGGVFEGERVLLVRERSDGRTSTMRHRRRWNARLRRSPATPRVR